ncbi:MAG TPA: helix-turn-helix domain-containing protein [Streptosporangiaceae bacterium]|nr:helix-turn-helix domain-containing protein [Streptosporangiaceae bacterium]
MTAAAELIAELGWGRVTTRAVAERAGLPHGAVSYHFRGKQELLIEAAMFTFAQAIPAEEFAALAGVEDFIGLVSAEVADRDAIDPVLSRLMFEAMREAERDAALRERMRAMLAHYRSLMIATIRAGQERGTIVAGVSADAIATLLGALGDGLLLHVLLDPDLDVHSALDALRTLLAPRPT